MSLPKLAVAAVLGLAAIAALAASAPGALVAVDNLVLRADGGFSPQVLPRRTYAPINFNGHFDIKARGGGRPSPLNQVVLEFDRDGKLTTTGLPSCSPASIDDVPSEEARRICADAIVGTGNVEAMISMPGENIRGSAPLTVFNGPALPTGPSVVLHARNPIPKIETFAVLAPIEQTPGPFRYRVRVDVPSFAEGKGSLIHADLNIGRRFQAEGALRSYVSARCRDHILYTHGRFTFDDSTVIDGQVEKYCRVK
jgi:hypothetical protein